MLRQRRFHEDEFQVNCLYIQIVENMNSARINLINHPVYKRLNTLESLQIFMESHVFAVWDFMLLLKTLQRRLTSVDVPWLPPTDILSARLINDIVLVEETDEIAPGCYTSHFDLYLKAMVEIGADTSQIKNFIYFLRKGFTIEQAISYVSIPESTRAFVLSTLAITSKSNHEVAASFLLGREDIIPTMFRQILASLSHSYGFTCDSFRLYLDRHTHIDEEQHSPMGQQLLKNLCGEDVSKWEQALHSAENSLKARYSLWDGVLQSIQAKSLVQSGVD